MDSLSKKTDSGIEVKKVYTSEDLPKDENKDSSFSQSSSQKGSKKSKTPVLDNFGRDLTAMAEQGKLDPKKADKFIGDSVDD